MSNQREVSDEELMEQYRQGVAAAFDQLYRRHKGGLYRYFLRQCHSNDIAEELYQDVWLKLVNAREHYEVNAKFTTYLYRIAHNRLVDYYRHLSSAQHKQKADGDHQELIDQAEAPIANVAMSGKDDIGKQIKNAVAALPFEQREVFLMQQEGHLSLADIAQITESSRETVKSRLRYAMQKLRTQLGELKA
ncbi:RNA polymerase sigma factor [Pleionea sp. CnH1-48]|uniref:RNA polymerase sigma factor n=1 Tax=Pleionea sp. CnH1-48 TaxID=2954494 RepID=UPI0020978F08|nr:RNA polymerase sigma factor [Pleionea sp. CnH1-48]MCO7224643.1 RNA polymerase sigma factor [Pleionea sp. CnH1-48]